MIYARPTTVFEATLQNAPTGLIGTLGVRIIDAPTDTTLLARTTGGIVERPAGSGIYTASLTAPAGTGDYLIVWDTGGGTPQWASEELLVTSAPPSPLAAPGPAYASPEALRAELTALGVAAGELPDDDAASRLIGLAEEQIDELVAVGLINETTGRLLTPADILEWQRAKLQLATVAIAATLHANPQAFEPSRFESVSGPQFSKSKPVGRGITPQGREARRRAAQLLQVAGLRVLAARAVP